MMGGLDKSLKDRILFIYLIVLLTITSSYGEIIDRQTDNFLEGNFIIFNDNYMGFINGQIGLKDRIYFLVPLGINIKILRKSHLNSSIYHHYLAFSYTEQRLGYLSKTGFNVKIYLNRIQHWLFPFSETGDILFYFFKSAVEVGGDYLNSRGVAVIDTFSAFLTLKFIVTRRFYSGLGIRYFTFKDGVVQSSFLVGLSYKNFSLTPEIRFMNKEMESPFEPVYPFRYRVFRISIRYSF